MDVLSLDLNNFPHNIFHASLLLYAQLLQLLKDQSQRWAFSFPVHYQYICINKNTNRPCQLIFAGFYTSGHRPEQRNIIVFNLGWILVLNFSVWTTIYCVIQLEFSEENTSGDRLVSCCSAYSIIKCCYCEKSRVNTSLAKSANIGYRLKIEMATDAVCLHFKINSWFPLIHEKYYPNAIYQCRQFDEYFRSK